MATVTQLRPSLEDQVAELRGEIRNLQKQLTILWTLNPGAGKPPPCFAPRARASLALVRDESVAILAARTP